MDFSRVNPDHVKGGPAAADDLVVGYAYRRGLAIQAANDVVVDDRMDHVDTLATFVKLACLMV